MTAGGLPALVAEAPTLNLPTGTLLHRIHRADRGPWWFGADDGRFDPTGIPDLGACYLAEDTNAAWVEVFGTARTLIPADVGARRLTTIQLGADVTVVDLACGKAVTSGITNEHLHGHHQFTQTVATEAARQGHGGMRWRPKHDLSAQTVAVALFGPTGALEEHEEHELVSTLPLEGATAAAACEAFGYVVLEAP